MEVTDSCPVCLEPWNKTTHTPKFLSCHHTLCLDCVVTLFENAVAEEGGGGGRGGGGGGEEGDWQGRRGRERGGFVQRMRGGSPSEEVPSPWSPTSTTRRFIQFRAPERHPNPKVACDVKILCPMCRSSTLVRDPNSLQTNFYLGSLRRTPSVPRLLLWCETCDAIAEPACGDHSVHPLPDRVKALKDELTSSSIFLLENMHAVLAEQNRHMKVYKWLCTVLSSARDQVKQAFVKTNNDYNITAGRIQILQQMLDECEAVCAKVEDEEKVTELLRLQTTLRANNSSWYGDEGGEEEREGIKETGGEKKRRRISLPVFQNLFYIHSDTQPPDGFENAHVIMETNVVGTTLSVLTKYEIEKEEESGEEEMGGQTEVDVLRRSSWQQSQNPKKGDDKRSLSFSVTDAAHRRLGPSRSPSTPAGMCGTLPASPRAPSGSHIGAPTINPGTNTMPSRWREGPSTATPNTVGVPVPAPRAPPPDPFSYIVPQDRCPELLLRDPQLTSSNAEETRPQQEEQAIVLSDDLMLEASCSHRPPFPWASEINAVSLLELLGEPSSQQGDEAASNILEFLEESPYLPNVEPQARPNGRRNRSSRRPEEQNRGRRRRGNACVIV